jgi:aryl-alcohol dehydrogenase-like predicted oxidoreductase
VGCSNHPAWRLVEALWASDRHGLVSYTALQPHYNLVHREEFEREMAHVVETHGIGVIPYSPLAGGFLTGKYRPDAPLPESARSSSIRDKRFSDRNFALLARMDEIGQDLGHGVPQVALAWLLANPLVTAPIVGANSVEQLSGSLTALELRLGSEEIEILNQLSEWQSQ